MLDLSIEIRSTCVDCEFAVMSAMGTFCPYPNLGQCRYKVYSRVEMLFEMSQAQKLAPAS